MPRTFILLRPNLGELQIGIKAKVKAKVIENQALHPPELHILAPGSHSHPPHQTFVPRACILEVQATKRIDTFQTEESANPCCNLTYADLPDYVPDSNPEVGSEEDDDEDPEEDPTDYPTDREDDGIDKDEPSDDEDEEVDIEADDEEEEEHLAPTDSTTVALPAVNQAPS
ncbi:hypothetical protein Tco_0411857 [Tanacetum coccineum]